MARITKSETAPDGATHFSLGQAEFDLASAKSVYETDDPAIIAAAGASPFLSVEIDPSAAAQAPVAVDPLDPRVNPAADHLSVQASQAAIDAATANNDALRTAGNADIVARTDQPTTADAVRETFEVAAPADTQPTFPSDAETTAAPTEPTAPGGGVVPDDAPTSTQAPGGGTASTSTDDGSDS